MSEGITHSAPITVNVAQVCELTGLLKSSVYRLFYNGKLTRRKLGGKTLVLMSELRELLETLPEAA